MERPTVFGKFTSDVMTNVSRTVLLNKNAFRVQLFDHFWNVWQYEFLLELPKVGNSYSPKDLTVGSIVLVKENGSPRLQ